MDHRFDFEKLWDYQYKSGLWDVLKSPKEYERFEVVRKFIYQYSKKGSLLELGCGIGLLQAALDRNSYKKYIGIDISNEAIKIAKRLEDQRTFYLKENMENYEPKDNFDLIVFSETIYYSKFPIALIEKYFNYVTVEGKIIISIFETGNNLKIINNIDQNFCVINTVITENSRGRWNCMVIRKNT
jgi:2-polyprenyl-3-methyl-5-hydroxy-6-metoxy-1,4-benzoquinol methylase